MKFSRLASSAAVLPLGGALAKPCAAPIEADVAIIGGGSAGIHAAIRLRDAGASVVVVEKKHQIGGHAETYINPQTGVPANVGVVIFENRDVVSSYFDRLNVSILRANPLNPAPGALETKNYDFALGIPIPAQSEADAAAQQAAVQAAAQSYAVNVLAKYPWIDEGFLVPDPVPEELALPFGELAARYNFTALLPIIWQFSWYAGDITTIPSLYGIKGFGPGLFNSTFGEFILSASGDTRSLYEAAARELGDDVLLNATVVEVDRSEADGVSLVVQQPGQTAKQIRAKKLLIAAPPTLDNVGEYDLSDDERELFSKFFAIGYWTGVATIPGLETNLANIGVTRPANQPIIPGTNGINTAGSPGDFLFGVGFDRSNYTDADGEAVMRDHLTKLAAAGAVPADAAETVVFPYYSNHAPFNVRVSAEEIRDGFYGKLLALEGERNTYWAGAAFGSQNSALVWSFNEGTVLPGLKRDLGL
ncbi:flavin-containing superfamily Amine oxidase [Colletotrichum musicola]|uniref:Flavin-containing superfamily Amine oxidase n=1 Tax=Colletotrichum musicola TaxID=2175873 RepID=A0A8H6N091_9PEZI|nr:flavin-containing superfamily Amine oxidase [Colletotrichum musicola]